MNEDSDLSVPPATTMSGLLEIAVNDAEACETSTLYTLDMRVWVKRDGDVCRVCMAGAVLAKRYDVDDSDDEDATLPRWAEHVNSMRKGDFWNVWKDINGFWADVSDEVCRVLDRCEDLVDATWAAQNFRAPWFRYRECVELLKGVGL